MEVLWDRPAGPCARSRHALQQDPAYGAACTALGSRVLQAEIRDGGVLGRAILVHRRILGLDVAVCTRGPVWHGPGCPESRAAAIAALGRTIPLGRFRAVFFTPEAGAEAVTALRGAGLQRVMTPYTTAAIDLTNPASVLRAAMHQKWRNRLAAAEQSALRVVHTDGAPAAYDWLLAAEAARQRKRRYAALPPALVPVWQRAGGRVLVQTAFNAGEPVAAMLFLLHGRAATYHIGWTSAEGRHLSAGNLVMWTAMRKLARAGVEELDLGGLNTEDIPGIARFKLGTGATVKSLCGTWFGR